MTGNKYAASDEEHWFCQTTRCTHRSLWIDAKHVLYLNPASPQGHGSFAAVTFWLCCQRVHLHSAGSPSASHYIARCSQPQHGVPRVAFGSSQWTTEVNGGITTCAQRLSHGLFTIPRVNWIEFIYWIVCFCQRTSTGLWYMYLINPIIRICTYICAKGTLLEFTYIIDIVHLSTKTFFPNIFL